MRTLRSWSLGVIAVVACMAVTAANATTPRTEIESYTGPDLVYVTEPFCYSDQENIGGACFSLEGVEKEATIKVADQTGQRVYVRYTFLPVPDGPYGGTIGFCNSTNTLKVPVRSGATQLLVRVGAPLTGCGTAGTTGTITVDFT